MKYFLYFLLISSACLSCKTKDKQNTKDSLAVSTPLNETQQLIDKFKPILQGVWVKSDYVDDVAKTRSPLAAFPKADPTITTMVIEADAIKGDSVMIDVGYGLHEGGNLILRFHPGKINSSIVGYSSGGNIANSNYEFTYSTKKGDTTLTLYTYDEHKKLADSAKYFKAFHDQRGKELGYATYYSINRVLFAGNYSLTDSLNNTATIRFTSDGKMSGLNDLKTYFIAVDFTTPPKNMDEIYFSDGNKDQRSYTFKFKADTLNLFETSFDKDSIDLIKGKLKYQLIRKK